ncbi:MAG TPA: substrate-binding domain-containing protein [Thermomicrobiales bacterium]|nr:substrate-binding domain-containing protein [Thermomicrobiales bacterium]
MSDKRTVELARLVEASLSRRRLMQTAVAAGAVAALPLTLRGAAAQETLKIAFSVPGLNFPFFVHMMKMAQEHAQALGNIDFVPLDGQDQGSPSSAKQSSDLEAAVASGVKGIVISPNDADALAPAIQAAIDAGVPVVTVDRNVTGAKTLAHVGADNVKGGELQGEYVVKILPDGGDIYELQGQPGATPAIDRHKGLDNVLSKDDKIKVPVSQTANFDRAQATSVFEAALQGNPPPKAVVCANDDMALGVVEVAKAQNLSVPILGYDSLPEALLAIRDGQMAATIEQFPGQQASQALDILVAYLREKKEPAQHDTYLTPALITKDNLGVAERAVEAGITPAASPAATPAA